MGCFEAFDDFLVVLVLFILLVIVSTSFCN
ncbi:YjcZ family sporulation protein [Brevibacillus sp. B_LB10_24]